MNTVNTQNNRLPFQILPTPQSSSSAPAGRQAVKIQSQNAQEEMREATQHTLGIATDYFSSLQEKENDTNH